MPSVDSSWILSLIVMEQYNGEPGALRGACPVLREDCANLPPKGGKAALSYSTWIWRSQPFNMLIMYANITKMPEDFLEAAQIDGANFRQKLFYIIIPYLKPTFAVLAMLTVTNGLRLFDLIWVMTQGGPGGASDVMTSYIYTKAFTNRDFGAGTAASVILMLIMVAIMAVKTIVQKKRAGRTS